jgi:hypothetical protein
MSLKSIKKMCRSERGFVIGFITVPTDTLWIRIPLRAWVLVIANVSEKKVFFCFSYEAFWLYRGVRVRVRMSLDSSRRVCFSEKMVIFVFVADTLWFRTPVRTRDHIKAPFSEKKDPVYFSTDNLWIRNGGRVWVRTEACISEERNFSNNNTIGVGSELIRFVSIAAFRTLWGCPFLGRGFLVNPVPVFSEVDIVVVFGSSFEPEKSEIWFFIKREREIFDVDVGVDVVFVAVRAQIYRASFHENKPPTLVFYG